MFTDLSEVPERPGIYLFKGPKDKVLYVGKARSLRNRLRSYFQERANLDPRKAAMIKAVKDFSYVVTDNELEALILEANFIKQFKPRYNIVLRDDKNYPYLKMTVTEEWPKIEVVRRIRQDGDLYFGPYVPAQAMWEALAFIRRTFSIRTCGNLLDRPRRPCIQHQMGKCSAPCAGKISRDEYMKVVDEARLFLLGQRTELVDRLEQRMHRLAEELRFEEAAALRDRRTRLKRAFESQKVVAPELEDLDIFGYYRSEGTLESPVAVHVQFLRNGMLIGAKDFYIERGMTDRDSELTRCLIGLFYSKEILPPATVLTNTLPKDKATLRALLRAKRGAEVVIEVPREGKKLELLRMANENARLELLSREKPGVDDLQQAVKDKLGLARVPRSIGAFDVSTIQGSESVGAFVFWKDGDFDKDRYRHLRIKAVEGVDDFAMMREIVGRTVRNLRGDVPDLLLIDGGRGQLDVALEALREADVSAEAAAVAKKPDRVFLKDGRVIDLEDRSRSAHLLKRIRDEVHRFAITFHRKLRDKRLMESPLEGIPGIGKKRRLELLRHFGGLDAIRRATDEDFLRVKGFSKGLAGRVASWAREESPPGAGAGQARRNEHNTNA